jgi:tight adherence protein B
MNAVDVVLVAGVGWASTALARATAHRRVVLRFGSARGRAGTGAVRTARIRSVWRARRDRIAVEDALPDLAEGVARELRVGGSVTSALATASELTRGALALDLARVRRGLDGGASLASALSAWSASRDVPGVTHLVAVISLGNEIGGELAPALDAAATSMRDIAELRSEVASLTAQSRASAGLLTGLPPVAALGLGSIEPATAHFLVGTPPGWLCLGASASLLTAGWSWMKWLAVRV